jgi:hypothetical protein
VLSPAERPGHYKIGLVLAEQGLHLSALAREDRALTAKPLHARAQEHAPRRGQLTEGEIRDVYRRLDLETEEARKRLTQLGEGDPGKNPPPEWEVVWDAGSSEG